MQYAATRVGAGGFLLGLDLVPLQISLPSWVKFVERDMLTTTDEDLVALGAGPGTIDLVL
jgi:23S rRNA U2552 (ribose-2'-O)-methylase RlmE/FtsJ